MPHALPSVAFFQRSLTLYMLINVWADIMCITVIYLKKSVGRGYLLEGEHLLETIRYAILHLNMIIFSLFRCG